MTERYKTLTCHTADGRTWRVKSIPILRDLHGKARRIQVLVSGESGDVEYEVPLKLDLLSWLRYGFLATIWPPERAKEIRADGESVVIRYWDEWIPFEQPVLPFGYDRESEWEARFDPDPARQTWHLTRLRHLDYESGEDKP